MMRTVWLLGVAAALAGCSNMATRTMPNSPSRGSAASSRPVAASPAFYVMRHLQRGEGPDPGLSAQGRANAERLVAALADAPPAAIFVSTTRRARESAAPLAASLGLTVREYDPADPAALIAAAAREAGTVLIVGHSNTVADIIARLGGAAPPPLDDGAYGDIWRVDRKDGRTSHERLGE